VLQFAIALVLCGDAGVVLWQNHHVAQRPLGFRTAGLMTMELAADVPVAAANGLAGPRLCTRAPRRHAGDGGGRGLLERG